MKKSNIATLIVFLLLMPATLYLGAKLPGRSYYKTLSPGLTPANFTAMCSAAVPADNATAYLQPTFSQIRRSTSLIFAPTVDIQLVS